MIKVNRGQMRGGLSVRMGVSCLWGGGTRVPEAERRKTRATCVIWLRDRYLWAWEQNPMTSAVDGGLLAGVQVGH